MFRTLLSLGKLWLIFMLPGLLASASLAQTLPGSGNSLSFNGVSTYVNCGTADRCITSNLTVEAWIKTTSSNGQFAVTKYSNSLFSESGFEFGTVMGRAGIWGRAGIGMYLTSGTSITAVNDGRWHHIAGQVAGNVWRIYVDGVLENSASYNYSNGDLRTPEPMTIGTYTYLTNYYFNGQIDEVRVWRTARTAAEIQANMCRKFAAAPADLVAYYRFDQTSGLTALDQGSVPTTGALQSFSGNPWTSSGAPLGDVSASRYQNAWAPAAGVGLLTATGDSAVVRNLSAATQGVQLYAVNSAPSIAPAGSTAASYAGVFTVGNGTANAGYSLRIRPGTGPGCKSVYTRLGNDQLWTLPPQPPTTSTSLLIPPATYRGEYLLTSGSAPTAAITGDSLLCAGTRTQLVVTAPGSFSIRWNDGTTLPTLSNVGPGTYRATVTFSTGCIRTVQRTVRLFQPAPVIITGDSLLCAVGNTVLTASSVGATAYRWSTGATTATLNVSQPGTYTVTVTSGPGCTATARRTVRVGVAVPPFTLGADTTLCEADQLVLRGPAGGQRYLWSDNSTASTLLVRQPGTYTLRVSSECGTQTASRMVVSRSCLKIPNIITPNNDFSNDHFVVQNLRGDGWALEVYNRWGRLVFQTTSYHNDWGREAAAGLYYILLRRAGFDYRYQGWLEVLR